MVKEGLVYNLAKCPQCEQEYAILPMGMNRFLLWESRDLLENEQASPMWAMNVSTLNMSTLDMLAVALGAIEPPPILAACPECDSGDVEVGVAKVGELNWPNFQWPAALAAQKTSLLEILTSHAAPVDGGWLHLPPPPLNKIG